MSRPTLLDPLTAKELNGISRRGQTYAARVVYVGLIAVIIYIFSAQTLGSSSSLKLSDYANLSRRVFAAFIALQVAFVSLAAVAAAADSITREVRAGTLGILLLTPLTPLGIAWGKWKAALAQATSLMLCGLPVLAICVYLGGTGAGDVLWSTCLTFALAALSASLAVRASALCSTSTRAVLWALLGLLISLLFPLALLFILGPVAPMTWPFLHPAYALYAATAQDLEARGVAYGWVTATPIALAASVFVLRSAARAILRRAHTPPALHSLRGDFMSLDRWYSRVPGSSGFRSSVWENQPLLWKELATRAAGRLARDVKQIWIIYTLGFIVACWFITWGRSPAMFGSLCLIFLTLAVAGGSALFASEKEGRRLEMLLSSPVTAGQIVRAKLLSGVVAPEALAAIAVWAVTVLGWSWWAGPAGIFASAAVSGLFLAFGYLLAAACSLRAASHRAAFRVSAGILIALLLAIPSIAALIPSSSMPRLLGEFLRILHPLEHFEALRPFPEAPAAAPSLPLYALIYGGASLALGLSMPSVFRRVMGRV